MEIDGLIQENAKLESMEAFIIDTLLKGGNVVIPDFGHLEVKSLGGRHTILFKPSKSGDSDSFLEVMSTQDEEERKNIFALYNTISTPLKEEKLVSLPQIGLFHPIRRENGEIQVSFMPSSSIRRILGEEDEKAGNAVNSKEEGEENGKSDDVEAAVYIYENKNDNERTNKAPSPASEATNKIDDKKSETKGRIFTQSKDNAVFKPSTLIAKKQPQADFVADLQEDDTGKPKKFFAFLLIGAAAIVLFAVAAMAIHSRYNVENMKIDSQAGRESTNLPLLAEQHYGNPVFWIYIYEANKEKLSSPINIPGNVSLVIPDLKNDYDVDVTDSLEIVRANILADYILKKGNKQ